jgi:carbon storage regulator CsrA
MLILSRKNQESVVIGGVDGFHRLLKVTVIDIARGRVRLGFEVDTDVPVHRAEIWERIVAEGRKDVGEPAQRDAALAEGTAAVSGNGKLRRSIA